MNEKSPSSLARVALILTLLLAHGVQADSVTQPPRWVSADDVRVRTGPNSDSKVIGTLPRGAEIILKAMSIVDDYCLIEGEGQYGYVACQYLSAKRINRPKAGEDGIDAAQRWVSGNAVTVREKPMPDATVVSRVALNSVMKLLRSEADNGYCEIQLSSGQGGFTACRYLSDTPVVLAHVQGYRLADEPPPPDYDPERAFWLEPSWRAMESYVEYFKALHPEIPSEGPWPRDEVLERMKAHLALGLMGRKPEPYPDWSNIKRKASQDMNLSGESTQLQAQHKSVPVEVWRRERLTTVAANELGPVIGNWGFDDRQIIQLVRALEFASVQASLFRSEMEIAPPSATAEQASGRFGIVFRQLTTPRPMPKTGTETATGAGLYDMLARTQSLVRPVKRVQLFRDGRLRVESSFLRKRETLWREVDEPECSGWVPGFAFGDADALNWSHFEKDVPAEAKSKRNPAGSLFVFYTTIDLPLATALHTETPMKLDSDVTGFARGTQLYYDLNDDDIPDLAVWEGEGKGPGELGGTTTDDEPWYRLVLVNINGAWKVLGNDAFSYGCGC